VHRWYGLAHSFSPELVRFALRRFGLGPGAAVADPFCGAGTTLVEARRMAMSALGVDLPPVAVLASRVKCSAQDPGELRRAAAALRGRRGAPAEPADPEAAFEAPVAEAALKGLGLAEGALRRRGGRAGGGGASRCQAPSHRGLEHRRAGHLSPLPQPPRLLARL
jgi:hypothetical protein